jgi:hypothetical protein
MLTMYLGKFGFMPGCDVWTHHSETIHQRTASVAEDEDDMSGDDRMDEMFDAIRLELKTNHEDPPTPAVQKFFLTCLELQKRGRGRLNLTWEESVKRDLKDWCITKELALDRREWKLVIHVPNL